MSLFVFGTMVVAGIEAYTSVLVRFAAVLTILRVRVVIWVLSVVWVFGDWLLCFNFSDGSTGWWLIVSIPLVNANKVHLQSGLWPSESICVAKLSMFGLEEAAGNCHVHDELEWLIEWLSVGRVGRWTLSRPEVARYVLPVKLFVVDEPSHLPGVPFEREIVEVLAEVDAQVEWPCAGVHVMWPVPAEMNVALNLCWPLTSVLQDVNLSASSPSSVLAVLRHHPDSRP